MARFLSRALASVVAASLALVGPGLGGYQAAAAEMEGKGASVPPVPAMAAGLNAAPAAPGLQTSLPALPQTPSGPTSWSGPSAADAAKAAASDPAFVRSLPSAQAQAAPAASREPAAASAAAAGAERKGPPPLPASAARAAATNDPAAAKNDSAVLKDSPSLRSGAAKSAPAQAAADGRRLFDGDGKREEGVIELQESDVEFVDHAASPAERAAQRLTKRLEAAAPRAAAMFEAVMKEKAKGGKPVTLAYAFFQPDGTLQRVSQSPRGNGPSLAVTIGSDSSLSVDRSSQHNRMSRAQFKSRRLDGFANALSVIEGASERTKYHTIDDADLKPADEEPVIELSQDKIIHPVADEDVISVEDQHPAKPAAAPRTTGPVTLAHELLASALVSGAAWWTFTSLAPIAGPFMALVPTGIILYTGAKLALQWLDQKRKAHDLESSLAALRRAPPPVPADAAKKQDEEPVIELSQDKIIHPVADEDIVSVEDQAKPKTGPAAEAKKTEPAAEAKTEPVAETKAEPVAETKAEPVAETKPAPVPAPQPDPNEVVARRAAELDAAQKALDSAIVPKRPSLRQELPALALIGAVAAGAIMTFPVVWAAAAVAGSIMVAEMFLAHMRGVYSREQAEYRRLVSARDSARAALEVAKKRAEKPVPAAEKPAAKTEPMPAAKTEPAKTEPVKAEPAKTEPAKTAAESSAKPGEQLELPFGDAPKKAEAPAAKPQEKWVQLELPFGAPAAVPAGQSAPRAPPAPAKTPTPPSWRNLPADARETTTQRLVSMKQAAQKRARKLAPDAQLIGAAINLDDGAAHWAFVFHSKSMGVSLTVRTKSIVTKPWPAKKPVVALREARLAKLEGLEAAYTRLKTEKRWFKPVRVELVPARNADPSWRFIDSRGREVFVGGTPEAQPPHAFISAQRRS